MTKLLVVTGSAAARERGSVLFSGCTRARQMQAKSAPRAVLRVGPALLLRRIEALYLIDIVSSTTVLALLGRLTRHRVVVDTGDLVYALERSRGARSRIGLVLVWAGEKVAMRSASHIVVRGQQHLAHLPPRPATFAADLAPAGARPVNGDPVRKALGLTDRFVIGFVGSMNVAPRLGTTYGWEIVESLAHLDDRFAALFIGDGPGRERLESRARELGVAERCRFVGVAQGGAVLPYLGAVDAGISTQTNDAVGAVRTTGKLPLYLACGCPVLATDVGEARRLLGPLGWTVRYDGVVDRAYPERLAARLREWGGGGDEAQGRVNRRRMALELHAREFDPVTVRSRLYADLSALLNK